MNKKSLILFSLVSLALIFIFGCNAKTSGQQNGTKQPQLPQQTFHLKKTTPKNNYFPDNKEDVTLSLEQAQKLPPYPLLKPTYSPFKVRYSNASVSDDQLGNKDQKVLITYIGDTPNQFMQIEMQNKENIYGGAMKNNYEEVDLFQGVKGYVQVSNPAVSLFFETDGYHFDYVA